MFTENVHVTNYQLTVYIHVIYLVFINYHDPGLIFLVVY